MALHLRKISCPLSSWDHFFRRHQREKTLVNLEFSTQFLCICQSSRDYFHMLRSKQIIPVGSVYGISTLLICHKQQPLMQVNIWYMYHMGSCGCFYLDRDRLPVPTIQNIFCGREVTCKCAERSHLETCHCFLWDLLQRAGILWDILRFSKNYCWWKKSETTIWDV